MWLSVSRIWTRIRSSVSSSTETRTCRMVKWHKEERSLRRASAKILSRATIASSTIMEWNRKWWRSLAPVARLAAVKWCTKPWLRDQATTRTSKKKNRTSKLERQRSTTSELIQSAGQDTHVLSTNNRSSSIQAISPLLPGPLTLQGETRSSKKAQSFKLRKGKRISSLLCRLPSYRISQRSRSKTACRSRGSSTTQGWTTRTTAVQWTLRWKRTMTKWRRRMDIKGAILPKAASSSTPRCRKSILTVSHRTTSRIRAVRVSKGPAMVQFDNILTNITHQTSGDSSTTRAK